MQKKMAFDYIVSNPPFKLDFSDWRDDIDASKENVLNNEGVFAARFFKLLRLFKTERTITCEIVATLYGAWNDLLLESMNPTGKQIVDEVMTNWHESKERIKLDRWFKALKWMRQNDIVPTGYGMSTKSPVC